MRPSITLDVWLRRATRCLSAESAAQVRREIQEHYDSALQAATENGAKSEEAGGIALSSLGDPRVANRQYRRVLLTATEAQMLRDARWERGVVCGRP